MTRRLFEILNAMRVRLNINNKGTELRGAGPAGILKKDWRMAKEIVEAPMPGKIISVSVKAGDLVKEDDELCVLEAMKMENPILAPLSGKVIEIRVAAQTMVETGQVIAVIEH
jgi:biotin carboxyl carrier protein